MAPWALVLYVLYLALAFGGRTLLQLRSTGSTGSTGFKGVSGHAFSAEWTGGVLFVEAFLLALAALVVALEVRVRLVTVPYLLCTHGARYAEYVSRVGRFVPGVGREKWGRIVV